MRMAVDQPRNDRPAAGIEAVWVNGILSWQLTPGRWLGGGGVWAGFFNASFWPSLLFRTAVSTSFGFGGSSSV